MNPDGRPRRTDEEVSRDFWERVDAPDALSCWTWLGPLEWTGYGKTSHWVNGKRVSLQVHRYAYMEAFGPIPDGHVVHHECHNRACVNPVHLLAVTYGENSYPLATWSGNGLPRSHFCKRGHPFSLYAYNLSNGKRVCGECDRARQARDRSKKRAA